MGWEGYWTFGGSEVLNYERVEAYAANARVPWFQPTYGEQGISHVTGEIPYADPVSDPAPWYDADRQVSGYFWGAYPLSIVGVSDSTRTAEVTENISDGGWVGPVRAATRQMVFEVALIGANEAAVEYGLNWLKSTLNGAPCSDENCAGSDLCYLASKPCAGLPCSMTLGAGVDEFSSAFGPAFDAVIDPTDPTCDVNTILRTLRNAKAVSGPIVTAKRTATDGGAVWVVTFTVVAADPYEYGAEVDLIEGFGVEADPWVPTIVPEDWVYEDTPYEVEDIPCARPVFDPIVDPNCPAIIVPPIPQSLQVGCWVGPTNDGDPFFWSRRWFTLPRKYIPYWGDSVPVVKVQALDEEVRGLRLRFYSDLYAEGAAAMDDSCSFCGDILFSYIPPSTTLILDGVSEMVIAEGAGGERQRADSLVYATDGTPFEWPILSCGLGYVVAVDMPETSTTTPPAIDLSLVPRAVI